MATQSRGGTNKRQGKGSGRGGAARRRAQANRAASAQEATTADASGGSVAVAPRPERGHDGERGETSRSARKQPAATTRQGRLAGRTDGFRKIFVDTRTELRRVSWPDKETTQNLTLVVIAISVVLGILLGGIDFILFQIFEAIT